MCRRPSREPNGSPSRPMSAPGGSGCVSAKEGFGFWTQSGHGAANGANRCVLVTGCGSRPLIYRNSLHPPLERTNRMHSVASPDLTSSANCRLLDLDKPDLIDEA